MQAAELLRQQYPGLEVIPSNYPVSPAKATFASVVGGVQIGGIALTLAGDKILPALGIAQMPQVLVRAQQNKLGTCMLLWFMGGTMTQNLMKTGAFEVYFDGRLVFSKLQSKRMPSKQELLDGIDGRLSQPSSISPSTT